MFDMNIYNAAIANLGLSTETLKAEKKKAPSHQEIIEKMRSEVVSRIDLSVTAILAGDHKNIPMGRKKRIGYEIKIGYGKKNESLGFPIQNAATKEIAIAYLETMKSMFETGQYDEALSDLHVVLFDRADHAREEAKKAREEAKRLKQAA